MSSYFRVILTDAAENNAFVCRRAVNFELWALYFGLRSLGFVLWALNFDLWALNFGILNLEFGLGTLYLRNQSKFLAPLHCLRSSSGTELVEQPAGMRLHRVLAHE